MTINPDNTPQDKSAQEPVEIKTAEAQAEPQEDPNWRAFREGRKQDRLLKEAAEKKAAEKEAEANALKAAMEAAFARTAPPAPQASAFAGYEPEESEDERIEKKVQAAIAKKEKEYEERQRQREHQEYPNRIQQTYSDFNAVVTTEHLDYLEYHYPEIAGPLKRNADGFDKWSDIYKAIKRFVPNTAHARGDAEKANTNLVKPKSMSSSAITQGGEASTPNQLTEQKRAANWERMRKLIAKVD